ncbi:MAG: hypothetical protein ACYC2O_06065, partial [Microthrixaceae bacterium]
ETASKDWFGGSRTVMPIGIAEIGLPVVEQPDPSTPLTTECRGDLLTIDGRSVALRVVGTVGAAEALQSLQLEPCGEPVAIDAGRSLLESAPGLETGFDVELLTLASAAGGGAGVDTLSEPPDDGPTPPDSSLERTGRTSYDLTVRDATQPYWAVLGQSYSPGWTAVTSDGTDLGEPTLINGYANGWRVDPSVVGAETTITMKWTPQRLVWIGLGLSAVGVLVCLALIVGRPGRRRGAEATDPVPEGDADTTETVVDRTSALPAAMRPTFVGPFAVEGPALPVGTALAVTAVAGLVATLAGGLFVGAAVGIVTLAAALLRHGQTVIRVVCLGLYAASFGFIVAKQARNDYEVTFKWVERFEVTHAPTIAATLLLVVIVVLDDLRARRADGPPRS